jgi:hypothetical protein
MQDETTKVETISMVNSAWERVFTQIFSLSRPLWSKMPMQNLRVAEFYLSKMHEIVGGRAHKC